MARNTPYTYEEVKEIFAARGCQLLSTEYLNAHSYLDYITTCNHERSIRFSNFLKGKGDKCLECNGNHTPKKPRERITREEVDNLFAQYGHTVIEYKDANSRMKYICGCCGEEASVSLSQFKCRTKHKEYCSSCVSSNIECKRHTFQDVKDLFESKKADLLTLEEEYEDAKTPLKYLCPVCKEENQTTYNSYKNNKSGLCHKCAVSEARTHDITNQRFGMLVAKYPTGDKNGSTNLWMFECDCGGKKIGRVDLAVMHQLNDCGCVLRQKREDRLQKFKAAKEQMRQRRLDKYDDRLESLPIFKPKLPIKRIVQVWYCIIQRCYNENSKAYKFYGGKNVEVCDDWLELENFYNWAVNNGYNETLTIDRIDVDGNYSPDNCRWTDWFTQANNRTNNVRITIDGIEKTIGEWAREANVPYQRVYRKYKKGITGIALIS